MFQGTKRRRSEFEAKEEYIRSWRDKMATSSLTRHSDANFSSTSGISTVDIVDDALSRRLNREDRVDLEAPPMIVIQTPTNETQLQSSSEKESSQGSLLLAVAVESRRSGGGSQMDLLGPDGGEIFQEGLNAFERIEDTIARTGQNVDLTAAEGDPQIYVGLSAQSVVTISQTNSSQGNDLFPILDLSVELPCGKRWICAKMDPGCDINIISERAASRLVDVTTLEDSTHGPDNPIHGLSLSPVPAYKMMKLNFRICSDEGRLSEKNCRAVLHVVQNEYTHQAFDVLFGKKLVKELGLLELGERLRDASQNRKAQVPTDAINRNAGVANTMTA